MISAVIFFLLAALGIYANLRGARKPVSILAILGLAATGLTSIFYPIEEATRGAFAVGLVAGAALALWLKDLAGMNALSISPVEHWRLL